MRVLVTGAAGFIGSHLCEKLLSKKNYEVFGIDNLSTGKKLNIQHLENLKTLRADLCQDLDILDSFVASCSPDVIVHLAATNSVPKSMELPGFVVSNNVMSTLNVLSTMRENKVKRIIFASSSSVYGDGGRPISPYAASKQACESIILSYAEAFGIEPIILRLFNVFGPRQSDGPYSALIRKWLKPGPTVIYGDGKQRRDFTPVENVVSAICKAIESKQTGTMDIGCGKPISVLKIAKLMGRENIEFKPERPGDIRFSKANLKAAQEIIGYRPIKSAEEGIRGLLRDK